MCMNADSTRLCKQIHEPFQGYNMAFDSNGQQVAAGTHMHGARWSPCHIHSKILAMSEKMHMAFLVLPPLSLFSWQQFILASSRMSSLCNDMALKHTNLGLQLASSQHCQQSQLLLGEGGGGGFGSKYRWSTCQPAVAGYP